MKRKRTKPGYDEAYAALGKFRQKGCRHASTICYDSREKNGRVSAIQSICLRCGRISLWAKVSRHTFIGGFDYTIKF